MDNDKTIAGKLTLLVDGPVDGVVETQHVECVDLLNVLDLVERASLLHENEHDSWGAVERAVTVLLDDIVRRAKRLGALEERASEESA